ncbi:phosphatase PAP2 family protein [Brucepastera parasyntrophica]|uniref:phosphatase PAP2 family protein n=1 Tax=Brucepastera parasyntrophica TaxID=2880008 RepID=UPI00210AF7F8|nr:phosphatase PAP2 family protein [Brucepastera parasyntrophica]ULQ59073.1 phosphatase PAP2 family protein [Brucepastera parasyntrophica]
MKKIVLLVCAVCICSSLSAQILDVDLHPDFYEPVFKLSWITDPIIIAAGIGLNISGYLLQKDAPAWDGVIRDTSEINGFDRLLVFPYSEGLDIAGTALLALSLELPIIGLLAPKEEWLTFFVMYAESVLFAQGLKETMKSMVVRYRPYMYKSNPSENDIDADDHIRSFPSGHTTLAFTGAVFASYTFWSYFPESKWRIPVLAGSMTLATSVAVLRIFSGNHFLTDVLTGAAIGALSGFGIPFLHKLNARFSRLEFTATAGGAAVTYRY